MDETGGAAAILRYGLWNRTTSGSEVNRVRDAWERGQPTVGSWQGLISHLDAERIGAQGYDWVLLDMESSGLHWDSMIGLIQAIELGGSRAMVRVPSADPTQIMRALDYGAIGIVVPMVNTPEQAMAVGASTRYPPTGSRANGQIRRPYATHAEANADVVCVAMIEAGEGLAKADEIAAAPGIDALMIGQVDLALSLGWPLESSKGLNIATHPQALDALRRVSEAARRHDKHVAAGSVGGSDEDIRTLLEVGVDWLGYRPPGGMSEAEVRAAIEAWKKDFGSTERSVEE